MNFQQTLYALHDATENITVFASNAYDYVNGENRRSIGIRASCADISAHNDPIVDGTPFMIAGDIFVKGKKMTDFRDLEKTPIEDLRVKIRAIGGYPPASANVHLGMYTVETLTQKTDEIAELVLRRKNT